jgi:DNA (cytosine-5)-methyltransferase 1
MGLPDEFQLLHGSRRDRIRLLGNGVCPPVMQAVVEELIEGASRARTEPLLEAAE